MSLLDIFRADVKRRLATHIEELNKLGALPEAWFWQKDKILGVEKIDEEIIKDLNVLHAKHEDNPDIFLKTRPLLEELHKDLETMSKQTAPTSVVMKKEAEIVNNLISGIKTLLSNPQNSLFQSIINEKKISHIIRDPRNHFFESQVLLLLFSPNMGKDEIEKIDFHLTEYNLTSSYKSNWSRLPALVIYSKNKDGERQIDKLKDLLIENNIAYYYDNWHYVPKDLLRKETYTIRLIRHGPKESVDKHTTGEEAKIDSLAVKFIEKYANKLADDITDILFIIDTLILTRNLETAKIIAQTLKSKGKRVTGPVIDDRLGAFLEKGGKVVNILSPKYPEEWGIAEKGHQTLIGRYKEGRGMQRWTEIGLDQDFGDGITLREVGCRVGEWVFDNIQNFKDNKENATQRIGVSNSGFIEPFLYVILEKIQAKSAKEAYHFIGGAVAPLKGVTIKYEKGNDYVEMELPNKTNINVGINVLNEQKIWVQHNSKAKQVYSSR